MTTIAQHGLGYTTPGTSVTADAGSAVPWAAPTAGRLLVAALAQAGTPGTPGVTGFAAVGTGAKTNGAAAIRCSFWSKLAAGAESAVTGTSTDSDNLTLEPIEINGIGTGWVLDAAVSAGVEVSGGTSLVVPAVTLTDPAGVVLVLVGFQAGQPGAAKPTFTNGFASVANNRYGALATLCPGSSGAYGTTIGWTNSINAFAITCAVAPAPAGGGGTGGFGPAGRL